MKPARKQSWQMLGMRPRSEFAPDDLLRSIERRRARFMAEVMMDVDSWTIARVVARRLRGSHGEGLRGVFVPDDMGHGHVYWWVASRASHHEGRLLLRLEPDRSSGRILEVEVNVDRDTTLYHQFGRGQDEPTFSSLIDSFLAHPSTGPLIDGCLSRNGRLLLIDPEGRIRLSSKIPADDPHEEIENRRRIAWNAIEERARAWARSRSKTDAQGRPLPDRASISSFRRWIASERWMLNRRPIPSMHVDGGTIVLTWRGSDLRATIVFDGGTMSRRTVLRGILSEHGPVDVSTDHRMRVNRLDVPDTYGMRDHEQASTAKNVNEGV